MKKEFSSGTVYAIVRKLLGEIEPIGESNYDRECFKNIQEYDNLISMLLDDIQMLLPYRCRYEASMKTMGDYAESFVRGLKINCNYWIKEYELEDVEE